MKRYTEEFIKDQIREAEDAEIRDGLEFILTSTKDGKQTRKPKEHSTSTKPNTEQTAQRGAGAAVQRGNTDNRPIKKSGGIKNV